MPKINQEEYEVLKGLDDKWEWIARDKDGTLVMGAGKNERYLDGWFPPENIGDSLVADEINAVKVISEWGNLFQFIQWEDDEPYNIQELIEEYLYDNQPKLFIDGQEQSFEFIEESEEKEVKNKVELKSWFEDDKLYVGEYVKHKINQLDEPEVLSQEFIDKYKVDYDNWMPAVPIVHLQNLLVPKQELPVIPKFVAEWIEEMKQDERPLYSVMSNLMNKTNHKWSVWKSANKNFSEVVAQAWLDGYTLEKEQKYYAKIKGHENIYSGICFWIYDTEIEELLIDNAEIYPDVTAGYMLKATKEEWANLGINDDNADFVKVEELEE